MKKYKTTIIALIVIVVALVAFFTVRALIPDRENEDNNTEDEIHTVELVSFVPSDVNQMEVITENNNLVVALRYDGSWECTTSANLPVVQTNVKSFLTILRNAKGTVVYEGEMTDEKRNLYKIEDTEYINYTLTDGTVVKLSVGMQKPGSSSSYVSITNDPTNEDRIYLVTSTYLDSLFFNQHDLISTSVFSFEDQGKIRHIEIYKKGELFFSADADMSGEQREWDATYPLKRRGSRANIESLISAAVSLVTVDHVESNPDNLAKYGLEVPIFQLSLTDNKKTVTMMLGNRTPEGTHYYCLVSGIDDVLTIQADTIIFADEAQLSFIYEYAYMVNYIELTQLKFKYDGEEYILTYEIDGNDETLYFNGINVYLDEQRDYRFDFKCIGTSLYGIAIDTIEIEPNHTDEIIIDIEYTLKDGSVVTVVGYKRDDYTYSVYVNDEYIGGYSNIRGLTGTKENYGLSGCIADMKSLLGIKD